MYYLTPGVLFPSICAMVNHYLAEGIVSDGETIHLVPHHINQSAGQEVRAAAVGKSALSDLVPVCSWVALPCNLIPPPPLFKLYEAVEGQSSTRVLSTPGFPGPSAPSPSRPPALPPLTGRLPLAAPAEPPPLPSMAGRAALSPPAPDDGAPALPSMSNRPPLGDSGSPPDAPPPLPPMGNRPSLSNANPEPPSPSTLPALDPRGAPPIEEDVYEAEIRTPNIVRIAGWNSQAGRRNVTTIPNPIHPCFLLAKRKYFWSLSYVPVVGRFTARRRTKRWKRTGLLQ